MTPVFERAKTVHALDLAATVTGVYPLLSSCLERHEINYKTKYFDL
jgi:hypothetical protein